MYKHINIYFVSINGGCQEQTKQRSLLWHCGRSRSLPGSSLHSSVPPLAELLGSAVNSLPGTHVLLLLYCWISGFHGTHNILITKSISYRKIIIIFWSSHSHNWFFLELRLRETYISWEYQGEFPPRNKALAEWWAELLGQGLGDDWQMHSAVLERGCCDSQFSIDSEKGSLCLFL